MSLPKESLEFLLDQFEARQLSALEYEAGGFRLRLEKQIAAPDRKPAAPAETITSAPAAEPAGHMVKSPIVGTFYSAPAPDAPDFTAVGRTVSPGDVLCIVEAMKTMNEIECDVSGVITGVLARNGQLVEYQQPLFEIELREGG